MTLADNSGHKAGDLLDVAPLPSADLPSDSEIAEEMRLPFELTTQHQEDFRRDGFVKLANVLSPGAVIKLRKELIRLLEEAFMVSLDGGVRDRFLSIELAWPENSLIRSYVISERIGRICAELLDVKSVRLYHDNILSKAVSYTHLTLPTNREV